MNKRFMAFSGAGSTDYYGLIICAAFFVCGCVVGAASAGHVNGAGLSDYMTDYLGSGVGHAARPEFWNCLLNACKYHLLAVFFGFSLLGVVCVPALAAVRGFFLCFSVSAVVRLFGADGIPLALAMFGADAVLTVPCFFVLSVSSFSASLSAIRTVAAKGLRSGSFPYGNGFLRRCVVCSAVLASSSVFDMTVTPYLISRASARIF